MYVLSLSNAINIELITSICRFCSVQSIRNGRARRNTKSDGKIDSPACTFNHSLPIDRFHRVKRKAKLRTKCITLSGEEKHNGIGLMRMQYYFNSVARYASVGAFIIMYAIHHDTRKEVCAEDSYKQFSC